MRRLQNKFKKETGQPPGQAQKRRIYFEQFLGENGRPGKSPIKTGYIEPEELENLEPAANHFWLVLGIRRQIPFKFEHRHCIVKSINVKPHRFEDHQRRDMLAVIVELESDHNHNNDNNNDKDHEDTHVGPPDEEP